MTQTQKAATLTTVFSEVLANLAFMFTDEEAADPTAGELWFETTISYKGANTGTLRFWCSSSFSSLLAANLLGLDPEDDGAEEAARDATREFMNVLCGQYVTAAHGTELIFDLTIPEVRELPEAPDMTTQDDESTSTLCVDGHLIRIRLDA
jgi:chemotaxis protein CheY-P-specific phosphatase CheC